VGGPRQLVVKIRMSDGGQTAGALGQGLAFELGGTEFGDDHIHVTARGGDRPGQVDGDPADRAALGGGGQGDDGVATRRAHAGPDEVHLAAGAAEVGRAALLGVHLAGQVDLHG